MTYSRRLRKSDGPRPGEKGVLSLEYMILLAAFFSFLALLLPYVENSFQAGLFAIDSINAENFVKTIQSETRKLALLGPGSSSTIEAEILTSWSLERQGNILSLELKHPNFEMRKRFTVELGSAIEFENTALEGSAKALLTRTADGILIQYTDG